jgi:predicted acylesterase/phospholipase RssA
MIEDNVTEPTEPDPANTDKIPEEKSPNPFPDTIRHIVISGGGEFGFAFYTTLRESNRAGFWKRENIKTIYSTSAGSLFAFFVAILDHFSWEIYDDFFYKRPWEELFPLNLGTITNSFHQKGMFGKKEIMGIFAPFFNAMNLPLTATMKDLYEITHIENHIMVSELNSFSLVDISYKTHPDWQIIDAVYCSGCIPVFFSPYMVENKIYLDGGLICNYPVDQCLLHAESPNEIFGLNRVYATNPDVPAIHTLFDYIIHIFAVIFGKVMIQPSTVKNQIDFMSDEPINAYKIYQSFQSRDYRTKLFDMGVTLWRDFSDTISVRNAEGVTGTFTGEDESTPVNT